MNSHSASHQQGAALLLLMLAVILATSTVLLANLDRDEIRTRKLADTQQALAAARTALIEYALINPDINPGRAHSLPCPDIDDSGGFADGEAHTSACAARGVTVAGRLPWRTLGIPAPRDAAAACLWYVVSGSHKDAAGETAEMINADSNGQLQLFGIDAGRIIAGQSADSRPIAMVIAAMRPLAGQVRPGYDASRQCVAGADPIDYLDTDAASSIGNAVQSGVVDAVDVLAVSAAYRVNHNDQVLSITRADIERRVTASTDFAEKMRALGLAAAACVANYGTQNSGGPGDRRLPWPAPLAMADYRPDSAYNDADSGFFTGRLPDIADDSNATTGNPVARMLTDCDSVSVPAWTPEMLARWRNWKDHFFYAVAESHTPTATVPSTCSGCLSVNGAGQYAAVLAFANSRLPGTGQVRNAPPTDADTKSVIGNYLESTNASNFPGTGLATDFVSVAASGSFNDLLFCVDEQLLVAEC